MKHTDSDVMDFLAFGMAQASMLDRLDLADSRAALALADEMFRTGRLSRKSRKEADALHTKYPADQKLPRPA